MPFDLRTNGASEKVPNCCKMTLMQIAKKKKLSTLACVYSQINFTGMKLISYHLHVYNFNSVKNTNISKRKKVDGKGKIKITLIGVFLSSSF